MRQLSVMLVVVLRLLLLVRHCAVAIGDVTRVPTTATAPRPAPTPEGQRPACGKLIYPKLEEFGNVGGQPTFRAGQLMSDWMRRVVLRCLPCVAVHGQKTEVKQYKISG